MEVVVEEKVAKKTEEVPAPAPVKEVAKMVAEAPVKAEVAKPEAVATDSVST